MPTSEYPIVVGVFEEESQALRARDELSYAGFGSDQIVVAKPGEETAIHRILENLVHAGMPEDEITYCKREFQAGRTIVSVTHNGRHWASANILYRNRIHRYFKRLEGHEGAFPVSSANVLEDDPAVQILMEKIADPLASWEKLLTDAGLDKLLDEFD